MKTSLLFLIPSCASAWLASSPSLKFHHVEPRAPTLLMQEMAQTPVAAPAAGQGSVVPTAPKTRDWRQAVELAQTRAAAVKDDQSVTTSSMVLTSTALFLLPTIDNAILDLLLSTLLGSGAAGYLAGFDRSPAGDAARVVGRAGVTVVTKMQALDESVGVSKAIQEKMPKGSGEGGGLSYADIKKYGVAGTLAYILTELAFWIVAFPVASTTFYNSAGHWPDLSDGSDRTAVLAFIFAGANVARLAVPLRFGAAFALAPWVDENIVQKFGIGGGDGDANE